MLNYYTLIFIIHSTISSHQVWNLLPTYQTLLQLQPCSHLQEWRCCIHMVTCMRISNTTPMITRYMMHGPSLTASLWIPTGQRKWPSCRVDHVKQPIPVISQTCTLKLVTETHMKGFNDILTKDSITYFVLTVIS